MGIEYKHYMFVEDLSYIGTSATAIALHGVFMKWGLVSDAPTLFSLHGGKAKRLRQVSLEKITVEAANLLVEYPFTDGAAIAQIMGRSEYDDVDSRYFQKLVLLVGTDYRVYSGFETAYTNVTSPPRRSGKDVRPYEPNYDIQYYADAFPADTETEPPKASLESDLHDWPLPKGFNGIWRCGVILDCGKDVPAFWRKSNLLPSTRFAADIKDAFGANVVQIGHFY